MSFEHRGVVEGFYGEAWSQADRLWMLDRMGSWGMNRYLYAPKDDPLHRNQWRDAYGTEAMQEFGRLIEGGERAGVRVGFALSPGLSIHYSSGADVGALVRKFQSFAERGGRFFGLTLDDIPSDLIHADDRRAFPSLASAHIHLAHALREALGSDCLIWLVPTDYMGVHTSPYLEELGERLDPGIEVGWTGRNVLPATIRASDAEERARVLGRRLLVWDNTPVSDGPMRNLLHLGPYCGRDAELDRHCSGFLLNPMQHARASAPTLRTAADYLVDPTRYDADGSWRAALEEAGEGAPEAFAAFALAHRFSPLACDDRDRELEAAIRALPAALARPARDPHAASNDALASLRKLLELRQPAAARIRDELSDRRLLSEIEAWLLSHERECARMLVALDCLDVLCGTASQNAMGLAVGRMEGRLTRLPVPAATSFGPRRAFYPIFESLDEDDTRFANEAGLFIDRCLGDELIRLAEELAGERLGLIQERGASS